MLQLVSSPQLRGAQVHALELGRLLGRRGLRMEMLALADAPAGSACADEIPSAGRGRLRAMPKVARSCLRVDVVIAHGSSALPAAALGRLTTPMIYRNIGDPRFWLSTPARRRRVAAYMRRAQHTVALWPGARDYFVSELGCPEARVSVIPNGVDASSWPMRTAPERQTARRAFGLDPDEPIVLFMGSLGPEKNVGLALEAASRIQDVRLVVCGDGPEQKLVDAAITAGRRVTHIAPTREPRQLYLTADVLVSSSRSEGMPAVVIEAALTGVPAVATDVGALATMIDDGSTGFVVPLDEVAALADSLEIALERSASLGLSAREVALQRFELKHLAGRWEDVIHRVAARD